MGSSVYLKVSGEFRRKLAQAVSEDDLVAAIAQMVMGDDARLRARGVEVVLRALYEKGSEKSEETGVRLNLRSVLGGGQRTEPRKR